FFLFFLRLRLPPISSLFPYTTLFRSHCAIRCVGLVNLRWMGEKNWRFFYSFGFWETTSEPSSLTNFLLRVLNSRISPLPLRTSRSEERRVGKERRASR